MNTVLPLFLIPTIGFILITFIKDVNTNKKLGLFVSLLTFLESLRLWFLFDPSKHDFQFSFLFDLISIGNLQFKLLFALDGISLIFIILTTFLIPICLLTSWKSIQSNVKLFILAFLGLEILLIGVFTVLDLFGFYILFEAVLIPMFLIIGIFGSREQKIDAAYYFFFFTLIGSVLMLLAILYIYSISGTTDYLSLLEFKIDPSIQNFFFLAFFASLAVKIP